MCRLGTPAHHEDYSGGCGPLPGEGTQPWEFFQGALRDRFFSSRCVLQRRRGQGHRQAAACKNQRGLLHLREAPPPRQPNVFRRAVPRHTCRRPRGPPGGHWRERKSPAPGLAIPCESKVSTSDSMHEEGRPPAREQVACFRGAERIRSCARSQFCYEIKVPSFSPWARARLSYVASPFFSGDEGCWELSGL